MRGRSKPEMHYPYAFKDPVSACDVEKDLLRNPAVATSQSVGGGFTVSSAGNAVNIPRAHISTLDKNTNDQTRAHDACLLNWVVSPFSTARTGLFYLPREEFTTQASEAAHKAEEENRGLIARIFPS